MRCSKCGRKLSRTSVFCDGCGVKVDVEQAQNQEEPPQKKQSGNSLGKLGQCLLVVIAVLIVLGIVCTSLGVTLPELFGANREEQVEVSFQTALENREPIITLKSSEWDTNICPWSEVVTYIKDYIHATPELYFVDIRNTTISTVGSSQYQLNMAYFKDLKSASSETVLENAAESILRQVPSGVSDWEKAKMLHDALIRHVTYEEGTYDQTAYGALVEGKAVCMGYAMAYEYLLTKAGVECDTVLGYSNEISASMDGTALELPGHAWSIVTFRDAGVEKSYFVDTTWDDPDTKDVTGEAYISYRWFCVTRDDIANEGRSKLYEGYDLSRWNLDDDDMNYYVRTGSLIDTYDFEQVVQILKRQIDEGSNCPSLRVANLDVYLDLSIAMETGGDLSKLCQRLGVENAAYSISYDYQGDRLICFTLFLNYP